MSGALAGVRVLEFAGMGPAPFAVMMLSDMGAEVVRIDRLGDTRPAGRVPNPVQRGRRSMAADLKNPAAVAAILRMAESADVVVEGFRPGTMERLGLGPDACAAVNPRLVYARVTGWGQDGPYAGLAGHDINYIAVAGALDPIGRAGGPPAPPLNLVGDYGGGAMFAAFGVACALVEARRSGHGQVVDAAMTDGAAVLTTALHWMRAAGTWHDGRGTNRLDSGAHFYDVYETADGRYVSVGSIEPRFYAELRRVLSLTDPRWDRQDDPAAWPELKEELAAIFRTRTRADWCRVFAEAKADACFAPVLSPGEAPDDPHNKAREAFLTRDGVTFPAPAPRLSRTPAAAGGPPPAPGQDTAAVLRDWGFGGDAIAELRSAGAVG
ncbi:MAG TPA: CaiB/BaiF CoA-transferase family protein [Trebonia sp.]|nr:CaiB/BaiF CoA-transferase family protein [Trebonia sp.]